MPEADAPEKQPPRRPLRAGAAVTDITPKRGVSMDGIVMRIGPVEGVHSKLHARGLALDDGTTRLAIVVCDMTMISREVLEKAKALAHKLTGLPTGRMLIAATHTHAAPRMVGCGTGKLDKEYYETVTRRIAEAVAGAVKNLQPATVGWGVGRKPEYVRNRRWLMKPGTIGPNPFDGHGDQVVMGGRPAKNRVRPAGPVDPELSVLSVQRADGRPLALLANYSLHYVAGPKRRQISADYCGAFAERIEELLGTEDLAPPFVGIMSNGTFGDTGAFGGDYAAVGKVAAGLADEALRVYKGIQHRDAVSLAMRETDLELGVRRPDAERLAWAKRALSEQPAGQGHRWRRIFAGEALRLSEFPPKVPVKLQASRVGELGIAAIPCEPFAETGLAIKKHSPLKPTFVIGLANGYNGYLPTPEHHKLGGYETWPGRGSYLELEAEPKIRAAVLDLLGRVAAA